MSLEVYQWEKEGGRIPEWLEDIENGDAETPWTADQQAIRFNDMEQNFTICAWSKEKGRNMNEDGGWDHGTTSSGFSLSTLGSLV